MNPSEHPELRDFLAGLQPGELLSGTVAAIEPFGVFVALDVGPEHPVFPGVGFITIPELSWEHIEAVTDVVEVGQRVTCEFFQFDEWHMEARLSLRATQPDPLKAIADSVAGRELTGRVIKIVPIGVFVEITDGVAGIVHQDELPPAPVEVGDEMTVVVTEVDLSGRRILLSPTGRG